jgi:hypothetical protein
MQLAYRIATVVRLCNGSRLNPRRSDAAGRHRCDHQPAAGRTTADSGPPPSRSAAHSPRHDLAPAGRAGDTVRDWRKRGMAGADPDPRASHCVVTTGPLPCVGAALRGSLAPRVSSCPKGLAGSRRDLDTPMVPSGSEDRSRTGSAAAWAGDDAGPLTAWPSRRRSPYNRRHERPTHGAMAHGGRRQAARLGADGASLHVIRPGSRLEV